MGFSDDANKSADATEHKAYDLLTDGFGKGFNGPFAIVVDLTDERDPAVLERLATAVAGDPGIAAVQPALVNAAGDTAVLTAQPTTSPQDTETDATLQRLRNDVIPAAVAGSDADVMVGGRTALLSDLSERITARLPIFILGVVALSFLLLMVVFRSILVPLKAAIMNLLSIGAAYGVDRRRVPVGLGQGPGRDRLGRADQPVRADDHVRHPLRALDGLRGVPPVPSA